MSSRLAREPPLTVRVTCIALWLMALALLGSGLLLAIFVGGFVWLAGGDFLDAAGVPLLVAGGGATLAIAGWGLWHGHLLAWLAMTLTSAGGALFAAREAGRIPEDGPLIVAEACLLLFALLLSRPVRSWANAWTTSRDP